MIAELPTSQHDLSGEMDSPHTVPATEEHTTVMNTLDEPIRVTIVCFFHLF